jgi:ribosomal protein S18 acetylase RimI-like enzyme
VGYITVSVRTQPSFYRVKQVGAISGLMIHKGHGWSGIASQLFARAVDFFEEKGVKYLTLYTATANQAAIRFYQQHCMTPLQTIMLGRIDRNEND